MITLFLKITGHKAWAILAIILMVVGLQFPDQAAILSTGMITLLCNALFNLDAKKNIKTFLSDKVLIALTLVFVIFLISGIYSTNMDYLGERLRIKLPFVAMPIAFTVLHGWPVKWFQYILYLFFITIVIICGYEFVQYLTNYNAINKLYLESYVLTTPGSHVRFSLMVAFAVFVGAYLARQKFLYQYKVIYVLNIILTVFLLMFLHILAVRSGVLAFYIGISILSGIHWLKTKTTNLAYCFWSK